MSDLTFDLRHDLVTGAMVTGLPAEVDLSSQQTLPRLMCSEVFCGFTLLAAIANSAVQSSTWTLFTILFGS